MVCVEFTRINLRYAMAYDSCIAQSRIRSWEESKSLLEQSADWQIQY